MNAHLSDEVVRLRDAILAFSTEKISPWGGLSTSTYFPHEIWNEMGRQGFHGIAVPRKYGGAGFGYTGVFVAGMALVEAGNCLGFALSWLMNQLVAGSLFATFGSYAQKDRYLEALAQGKLIGALAVSEPGHGSHPKYLETDARKERDAYVISGKKTYITNGPIAGVYVVVAVSGNRGREKAFMAFIVPRDTPGLKVGEPLDLGFLRPCPHGGILLDACRVPAHAVLGSVGDAYRDMIVPFGEIEDVLMMGPVIGVMRAQLTVIRDFLGRDRSRVTDEILNRLGTVHSLLHTLEGLAVEACGNLDGSVKDTGLTELIISSRHLVSQIASELDRVMSLAKLQPSTKYELLARDLSMAASVAARITEIRRKKLGAALLSYRGDRIPD